jgi:tungsten cofactor oxidoreducase radical SAM maturase
MREETLIKLVNELKLHTELKEVVIGGIGEPTFSPYFRKALELLKDYRIIVTTNGTLLNEELSEHFIKYADVITVSIDGLDDKFEEIRGARLDLIVKNIEKLNELKRKYSTRTPSLQIQFVLSKDNLNDIYKVVDLASNLKADKFIISNMIPQSEENKDDILYTRYENKEIKNLFENLTVYALCKGLRVDYPNYELKTVRSCDFIEDSAVFICASGDSAPCYRFSHDYTEFVFGRKKDVKKYTFGNLENNTLMNIWNSDKYKTFREAIINHQYPSCMDCSFVEGCSYIEDSEVDCYALAPSCSDCLWCRGFVQCP